MVRCWGLLVMMILLAGPVRAQDSTDAAADSAHSRSETAWTTILERNGIGFSYILYGEADTKNNGLVLHLHNQNDYAVRYDFTLIFRGPEAEASTQVEGLLEAGEMKTGENDGLFWIPFEDGRSIGEVGLRGIDVQRVREGTSPPELRG